MKTRALIMFWLLMMAAACLIGALLFYLLRHEEERLRGAWAENARERAMLLAGRLDQTVREHQAELERLLMAMDTEHLSVALEALQRSHPLARQVFIWREGNLLLPDPSGPLTGEEEQFIHRYEPLFGGQISWRKPPTDESGSPVDAPFRWIAWHSSDQLGWLGAAFRDGGETVFGIEIEMMALLARLLSVFHDAAPASHAFELLDGQGNVLARAGALPGETEWQETPVGPSLPLWRVRAGLSDGEASATGGLTLIAAGSLAALLLVSLTACGSLLFWLARKNFLDARRKTGFVSNVSHELKTPLTTIRMYAEMLGEGRVRDEEKKRRYLAVITEECLRLTRLVNNVLDFSRLEQKRRTYRNDPLDIAAETRRIVEAQRPRIVQSGMELSVRLPEILPPLSTDRDALEQALLNLLDNAIKYAAPGKWLDVSAESAPDGALRLTVSDRGPGIPPALRKNLFRAFHRADDSLTAQHGGCGLGLSISRQMLRALGGDLLYEPNTGGGSRFVIVLPKGAP